VATELGIALARKGHSVHFVSYSQPARLPHFIENTFFHEVGVASYPLFEYPPYESALAGKLVDVAEFENLDLLHVHYAIPHAFAGFFAKQILHTRGINIPIVTTLHGTDITIVGKDASLQPVVEFSINHSDVVTTVSKSLQQDTCANFNITKEIDVIPNFIDFNRFSKTDKSHFKKAIAPEGEKILVHTSNFRKVKRVDDVIKAFKKVRDTLPAKLLLIGDGPERQQLETLCREMKVCNDVRFLGKQDAVEELLTVSDVFLMASEKESFGLAALEAMACEVPVISTNTGGLPELNIHGKTGYLNDVGDVDAMAESIIRLLRSDNLLAQFKKNAFEQAQKFDLKAVLPMYEAAYQKALQSVNCPTAANF